MINIIIGLGLFVVGLWVITLIALFGLNWILSVYEKVSVRIIEYSIKSDLKTSRKRRKSLGYDI